MDGRDEGKEEEDRLWELHGGCSVVRLESKATVYRRLMSIMMLGNLV